MNQAVNQDQGRILVGTVVSNKMDKSIVVRVERRVKHPVYQKVITRSLKVHVHDEHNQCNTEDMVRIQECRPISKKKTWKLLEILSTKKEN